MVATDVKVEDKLYWEEDIVSLDKAINMLKIRINYKSSRIHTQTSHKVVEETDFIHQIPCNQYQQQRTGGQYQHKRAGYQLGSGQSQVIVGIVEGVHIMPRILETVQRLANSKIFVSRIII